MHRRIREQEVKFLLHCKKPSGKKIFDSDSQAKSSQANIGDASMGEQEDWLVDIESRLKGIRSTAHDTKQSR